MYAASQKKVTQYLLSVFIILFLFTALSTKATATDLTPEQFQNTLSDTLKSLWIGESFSPELKKKQAVMKDMLKADAVKKAELEDMVKNEMASILNTYTTTYYTLQEIPEIVNELFYPHLDWTTFKEDFCWGGIAAQYRKNNPRPYVFKFGTLAPEGTPWLNIPYKILVPQLERLAAGTLKLKFYTGGVMGEDPDVLRKMDDGQLDGCGCTAFGVLKASPDVSVFMVPGLFKNYEEVDYVYKGLRKRLDKSFEENGYTCSGIIDSGFLYVFSKNKISSLADLRKQKLINSMGNIEAALLDELGIKSTPVAIPDVVSTLSTGMADAFIAPAAWTLAMQAYQYVNFYIKMPFLYAPGVTITTSKLKDRMSKHFEVSETLVENNIAFIILEITRVETEWKKDTRAYEEKSLKAFESKCGIKPVTLTAEDQKSFEDAAISVREKLADKEYPRDILNDVLKTLDQYRNQ